MLGAARQQAPSVWTVAFPISRHVKARRPSIEMRGSMSSQSAPMLPDRHIGGSVQFVQKVPVSGCKCAAAPSSVRRTK
jgi:hypothetical protein